MRIEIVAIGDEVLSGFTVNSNASRISRALSDIGLSVTAHRVLPDDPEELRIGLQEAMSRNDLVICSGGLGPTIDDRTRAVAAELTGSTLAYNEEVAKRLGDIPTAKDQATIPSKATPFFNTVGTAPGLVFEKLIFLPGVPVELDAMLHDQLVPYLERRFPADAKPLEIVHFFQLPEATVDAKLRELVQRHPGVTYGIYPRLGVVTVRLSAHSQELIEAFPHNAFLEESLEMAVHKCCVVQGLTLATAESCTGGSIAAALTQIPGASDYFQGAIVSYSNQAKEHVLNVNLKEGAVSEDTAKQMAAGLLKAMQSDIAVAVTGIAGPSGGTPEKPIGTVWTAVQKKGGEPVTTLIHAKGNRAAIIQRTVNHALAEVLKLLT